MRGFKISIPTQKGPPASVTRSARRADAGRGQEPVSRLCGYRNFKTLRKTEIFIYKFRKQSQIVLNYLQRPS